MGFGKKVWRVFSEADTALSWIGGGWKAGFVVMAGLWVSVIAWLRSLDGLYVFILGLMVAVLLAALFHFVKGKSKTNQSDIELQAVGDASNHAPIVSIGVRGILGKDYVDPFEMYVLDIQDANCRFDYIRIWQDYYKKWIAYTTVCTITNHSDMTLFKVIVPITVNLYPDDSAETKNRSFPPRIAGEPIDSYATAIGLPFPLKANESFMFMISNQSDKISEILFDETYQAQTEKEKESSIKDYVFESIEKRFALNTVPQKKYEWKANKNDNVQSSSPTFGQEFNLEAARKDTGDELGNGDFISLSGAAKKLYEELRYFDKGHKQVIIAESFRDETDGVLDYFATVISLHGEIFGKRPPSTKLEIIPSEEFNKGHSELRNSLNELCYRSSEVPEFIDLIVETKSLPKILEWLKVNNSWD